MNRRQFIGSVLGAGILPAVVPVAKSETVGVPPVFDTLDRQQVVLETSLRQLTFGNYDGLVVLARFGVVEGLTKFVYPRWLLQNGFAKERVLFVSRYGNTALSMAKAAIPYAGEVDVMSVPTGTALAGLPVGTIIMDSYGFDPEAHFYLSRTLLNRLIPGGKILIVADGGISSRNFSTRLLRSGFAVKELNFIDGIYR